MCNLICKRTISSDDILKGEKNRNKKQKPKKVSLPKLKNILLKLIKECAAQCSAKDQHSECFSVQNFDSSEQIESRKMP